MLATSDAAIATGYALDSAWYAERERLDSITRLYDAGTLEVAARLGITSGWRCLDVGAGTGSLAQRLADLVAPAGRVTALDVDTRFLDPLASDRLQVAHADVTREALPEGEFDLVHARLLLEHLPQREAVLAAMVGAAKPGGWVLIEDFDWSTALMVDPPSATHDKVALAIRELFTRHGYTPSYGRELPRALARAGLTDVTTRAQAVQVAADREAGLPQWELLADQFAPALLAAGLVDEADLDAFHALWHDGSTICFSPLMVSAWGRRP
ncbi:MAG: methyltransferase domain-containing protein [Solirubrobacteraceae bacterium]